MEMGCPSFVFTKMNYNSRWQNISQMFKFLRFNVSGVIAETETYYSHLKKIDSEKQHWLFTAIF